MNPAIAPISSDARAAKSRFFSRYAIVVAWLL
jgi:hypothetical protein